MSFFKQERTFILERKIITEIPNSVDKADCVYPVYDTIQWKLNHLTQEKQFFLMESQKALLEKLALLHDKNHPFGLCVSSPEHAKIAARYAHFLYVPAELCRQSDVLVAAAQTQLPLVVEKGCFLSPNEIKRLVEKIQDTDFALVECGSANGYSDCVLDPRSLFLMQKNAPHFGVSLSDLIAPEGERYHSRPSWLEQHDFLPALIQSSNAFAAHFFVIKNYGHGRLKHDMILKK